MKAKKLISFLVAATMLSSIVVGSVPTVSAQNSQHTRFASKLESDYVDPDRVYSSELRWWIGEAANTDEALLDEIQAQYDAGFRGVELCMQSDNNADNMTYAYGSDMWSHKWKLMMNKYLDLGMTVSLTSGTNWSTSNVPGLDPDSQAAMQCVTKGSVTVPAGTTLSTLAAPTKHRDVGKFLGAYAYKIIKEEIKSQTSWGQTTYTTVYEVDYDSMIDLTAQVTEGDSVWTQNLNWTAPTDSNYVVFGLWTEGTAHSSSPSAETSYATNYFDIRGVEALKAFWEEHYLNDPELNQKILDGDVQLFMDSLEIRTGNGFGWWAEDFADEFQARKGYDILPYIFLVEGACDSYWSNPYQPTEGKHSLAENDELAQSIIVDYLDVVTELYMERMLTPLKEWLNSVGIKTRAQISYGKPIEISEPIMAVDYPEAENRVMYNQIDFFRLWSGGAKLQNKVLSSECSAQSNSQYAFSNQMHLMDAYSHYAAGYSRMIWHIWSAAYSYGENPEWPGWGSSFYRFGTREPSARDYDEFNSHIGRIQQLLQTGVSRTDVGFIHNKWVQGLVDSGEGPEVSMNWMKAHQGVFYRSTELQDNGYSYDYFSPEFLYADDVYFDEDTKTIEQAGYKAIVLYQNWLDVKGAERILEWAKKGLKVVIIDGAAEKTPFNDNEEEKLASILTELKQLPTVRTAAIYDAPEDFDYMTTVGGAFDDGVYDALQDLGVTPYAEYIEPNHQLLTQTRQDDDGNMYLYAYNYCSNDYHENSYIEAVQEEDHGTNIKTEIKMDGTYVPYTIDAWTGEVIELAGYYYENGQTVFPIDLDYGNIALYAFEKVENEKFHLTDTNAQSAFTTEDGPVIRATESGKYYASTSDGKSYTCDMEVPAPYDITNWDVTVESWTAGTDKIKSEETIGDVHTINTKMTTVKTDINVKLDTLTTWDNIAEVGKEVSGLGHYKATFQWDADAADGAYLNFGDTLNESMKVWINGVKVGGDVSTNPSKVTQDVSENHKGVDQYTGGINWIKPVADIGEYLVDGENTIEIEYSSSLTNVQLSRGVIKPTDAIYNWFDYVLDYRSYGPAQAVVVPYVDVVVPAVDQNKTILNKVIEYAEAAYESDEFDKVIASVQQSFTAALENARAVAADLGADQTAIDSAWQALMKEIHKLGFVRGDKTSLGILLEMAKECSDNIDLYTEATAAVFGPAYETALAVYNDGNAMQDEVTEAENALLDALVQLRYRADKSVLEAVLAEASKVNTTVYTAETVAVFSAANEQANKVNSDPNAAQDEVDAAEEALRAAIDGLKAVETADETATVQGDKTMTTGSGNAKTGETTPVAAAVAVLALASACFVVSRKKR
ncbi:MAG: hypothetical protein SOY88_09615 [Massilioclostridium sp.]|nr:hypothetical protein [Massilioclostridium sp.]